MLFSRPFRKKITDLGFDILYLVNGWVDELCNIVVDMSAIELANDGLFVPNRHDMMLLCDELCVL